MAGLRKTHLFPFFPSKTRGCCCLEKNAGVFVCFDVNKHQQRKSVCFGGLSNQTNKPVVDPGVLFASLFFLLPFCLCWCRPSLFLFDNWQNESVFIDHLAVFSSCYISSPRADQPCGYNRESQLTSKTKLNNRSHRKSSLHLGLQK